MRIIGRIEKPVVKESLTTEENILPKVEEEEIKKTSSSTRGRKPKSETKSDSE